MAGNRITWQKAVAIGSTISTTLAGLVIGGFFLGQYLDSRLGTEPALTITLILAGLVLGGSYMVVTLSRLGSGNDKK